MNVLEVLTAAKGKPVSRGRLIEETGLPDRAMRREIEALRHSGVFIGNDQDGRGYYLIDSGSKAALCKMRGQMTRRAKNLLHQASKINRQIKKLEEQNNGI